MQGCDDVQVPMLAIVLGNESSLTALHHEWQAFPHGATYPDFRRLLEPYVRPPSTSRTSLRASIAVLRERGMPRRSTARLTPGSASSRPRSRQFAVPTSPPLAGASDYAGSNRDADRGRRVRSREELAGAAARPVDVVKQLFNRVDIHNQQRVSWENLVNYLVAEASVDTTGTKLLTSASNQYTFSRRLRGKPKAVQQQRKPTEGTSAEALTYHRFHRDVKDTAKAAAPRAGAADLDDDQPTSATADDEDLALIRFLDGLPGHRSLFFVSSRSNPFMLYSKETLERVFSAPPELLPDGIPSAVAYLPTCDLFLCYSPDDRLLRGWFSLLSVHVVTTTVRPLLLEGLVRRMRTMPRKSPSFAEHAETVFLGDSFGHILRVTAPRGRGGGIEFKLAQTYANLHTRESGGLVDFCVYGGHLYSSGFDGRLVVTSLANGQSSELGSTLNEHLTALVYVAGHNWVVAATSCGRELLWWEAHSHSSLPGAAFDPAGFGMHSGGIIALSYVASSDQVVSADCDGTVKVWDVTTQRCVQSFRSARVPQPRGRSVGGAPVEELKVSGTNPRATAHSGTGLVAGNLASLLVNLGLLALLPAGAGQASHLGGPQCHSLIYNDVTQELMCGFVNTIICWGLHGHANPRVCDAEEVCYDIFYEIRTCTFLLLSATRVSVWDGVHGYFRGALSHVARSGVSQTGAEIKAVCVDELGSRLFISFHGGGGVVVHSTHALAADAGQCTPETAVQWWSPRAPGSNGEQPYVEQMHYSSVLRTWIAITSSGALLVQTEEDNQEVLFSSTISVSTAPLTLMRLSEQLGLVAVADAQKAVYVYDMHAWTDAPSTKLMTAFGGLVDMLFLDNAPALVTVHTGGVCRCWSCAPTAERFELLGVLCHPQHPAPDVVTTMTVETERAAAAAAALERAQMGSTGGSRGRHQPGQTQLPPLSRANLALASGSRDGGDGGAAAAMLRSGVFASRPPSSAGGSRPATATVRSSQRPPSRAAGYGGGNAPAASFADYSVTVNEATAAFKDSLGSLGNSGQEDARERLSGQDELNATLQAMTEMSACAEFTCATYDGRRHYLFLGDSEGAVHTYRMCALLQAYKLPRCALTSRPAFSLAASASLRGAGSEVQQHLSLFVRTVHVHVGPSAVPESVTDAGVSQQGRRRRERSGVVCVRWIGDRGVLATTGHDHEVWFLNSECQRLACLSAERAPPRPEDPDRPLTSTGSRPATSSREAARLTSGLANFSGTFNASFQAPVHGFTLPPIPRSDEAGADGASAFPVTEKQPCCCTHNTAELSSSSTTAGATAVDGADGAAPSEEKPSAAPADPASFLDDPDSPMYAAKGRSRVPSAKPGSRRVSPKSAAPPAAIGAAPQQSRSGTVLQDFFQRGEAPRNAEGRPPRSPGPSRPASPQQVPSDGEARPGRPTSPSARGAKGASSHNAANRPRSASSMAPCPSSASSESQIHLHEWQARDLAGKRETRGMKPQAPVQPASHNTLVHVEESKGHSCAVAPTQMLLSPLTNAYRPAGRPATVVQHGLEPGEAAAPTEAGVGLSAASLTENATTRSTVRGAAAVLSDNSSTGPLVAFGADGEAQSIDLWTLLPAAATAETAATASLPRSGSGGPLCVAGSAVGHLGAAVESAGLQATPPLPQRSALLSASGTMHGRRRIHPPRPPATLAPRHRSVGGSSSSMAPATMDNPATSTKRASTTFAAAASAMPTSPNSLSASRLMSPQLPRMLAYTSAVDGDSTLQLYSSGLHEALRRRRRWDDK